MALKREHRMTLSTASEENKTGKLSRNGWIVRSGAPYGPLLDPSAIQTLGCRRTKGGGAVVSAHHMLYGFEMALTRQ